MAVFLYCFERAGEIKPVCKLWALGLLDQRGKHRSHMSYCSEFRRNETLGMSSVHYSMIGCGVVTLCYYLCAVSTYASHTCPHTHMHIELRLSHVLHYALHFTLVIWQHVFKSENV